MSAVVGFIKWCKWTQVSLVFLRGLTFESVVAELSQKFFLSKLTVIASLRFDEDVDDGSLVNKLQAIKDLRSSKVVVALALEPTYLKIALAARACEMITGWGWLGLDTVPFAANDAALDQRADPHLAFHGWVYFEPYFSARPEFFDLVHNATRRDFPKLFVEDLFPSRYAAALYDAITLFALVAHQLSWQPDQGGRAFVNRSIGNRPFDGITGSVKLDVNGDLMLSYQVVNLLLEKGRAQPIALGVFWAGTQVYSSNGQAIIWPGGSRELPEAEVHLGGQQVVIAGSLAGVVGFTFAVLGYVVYKNRERARDVLISFLSFELGLVCEACTPFAVSE
jgi:hypothetical protein